MRLIDVDAVINEMQYAAGLLEQIPYDVLGETSPYRDEVDRLRTFSQDIIKGTVEYLKRQPTVDAVNVIRCKDCRHNTGSAGKRGKTLPKCVFADWLLTEESYCSRAERREDI